MANERVLVADDDEYLSYIVKAQLSKRGFFVSCADNYKMTQELIGKNEYDVVILDMRLPDANGIEVCVEIRKKTFCPIILTSYAEDRKTIISALEKGGDDYMVKPLDTDLLVARINANIRRTKQYWCRDSGRRKELHFKQFLVERSTHQVWKTDDKGNKSELVKLSPTEYKLLDLLIENENNVLSYEEMYRSVWEADALDDYRTVMVHVSNLRKKINIEHTDMIHTVRGAGYMFSDV